MQGHQGLATPHGTFEMEVACCCNKLWGYALSDLANVVVTMNFGGHGMQIASM